MTKRYIGIKELSEYIGVSSGTLYVWVCHRKIPFVKIGRLVKFDLLAVEKWLEEKRVPVYN